MAEVTLGIGGVIDVVTPDELDGKLNDHRDRLVKDIERSLDSENTYSYRTLGNAVRWVTGNLAPIILPVDQQPTPPAGRIWEVQYLTVTAGDDHTSSGAATVASYIGALVADGTTPNPLDLLDPAVAFPNSASYGRGQAVVIRNSNLFVVINNPVNGTTYTATARVIERLEPRILPRGIR